MCIIRYQGKLADCHRRGIDVQIGFGPTPPGAGARGCAEILDTPIGAPAWIRRDPALPF
jgi:hypothetical protein